MYVPKFNEETDLSVMHSLITTHPLATWITQSNGNTNNEKLTPSKAENNELIVNHIPFLLDSTRGEFGTLVGHVARANPVWQSFSTSIPSILVFQGAESYISPSWYASKHDHGKAVPTWNYAVVHAYGLPHVIEDAKWLLHHLNQLTNTHEAHQALPWKVSDAPTEFIEQLLKAIVGIEIPIDKLIGKWKVSQNRPDSDKQSVVAALNANGDEASIAMASLVHEHINISKKN